MFKMEEYLAKDRVSENQCAQINGLLEDLRNQLQRLELPLSFTVTLFGSYGSGLASKSCSEVDILVKFDGKLIRAASQDQLGQALVMAIKDWSNIADLVAYDDNTGLISCKSKEPLLKLRMLACKSSSFPLQYLYHVRLFHSYANCHSRAPVFITAVKRWATSNHLKKSVADRATPFTGFHWTVIALAYLIGHQIAPNLHELANRAPDVPRMQYGPSAELDVFASIEEQSHVSTGHEINDLFRGFVTWLSQTDLLSVDIDIRSSSLSMRPPNKRGYLVIMDPCSTTPVNTVVTPCHQREHIVFGLRVRKAAEVALDQLTKDISVTDLVYPATSMNLRVDVAVP